MSTVSGAAPRTRPLSDALTARLLDAARTELQSAGPVRFRLDDIVASCHTSKSAVYRRWGSRDAFLAAAIESFADADEHVHDGDLVCDVSRAVQSWTFRAGGTEAEATQLIRSITAHEASRETYERVIWPRRRAALARTIAHHLPGDWAAESCEEVLRLPQSFVIDTVVARGRDITHEDITAFVRRVYAPLLLAVAETTTRAR